MNPRIPLIATLTLLICVFAPAWTHGAPMTETVPIQVVVSGEDPFEAFFENHFDPFLPKQLWFEGTALADDLDIGNTLVIEFHVLNLMGEMEFVSLLQISLQPGEPVDFHFHHEIPFCPELVRLGMQVGLFGAPVTVIGEFTHDCVPEPSSMALMGLATVGVVGLVLRRRRRR